MYQIHRRTQLCRFSIYALLLEVFRKPAEFVVGARAHGEPPPGRRRVGHHENVEDGLPDAEQGSRDAPRLAVRPLGHSDVKELVP